jgi:TonB family protein
MFAAQTMRPGRRYIDGMASLTLGLCLGACASSAPAIDPSLVQASGSGGGEKPAFFVQWKSGGMPGLTARPTMDKSTKLPVYPAAAVREKAAGTTSLEVCVTTEGQLVDVHVASSSGSSTLDDATVQWAKAAKYQPAKFNGEPFAVCGYRVDYIWKFAEATN